MADLTEPCPMCATMLRWETSHERCDGCGWIRPCCEGVPAPLRRVPQVVGEHRRSNVDDDSRPAGQRE